MPNTNNMNLFQAGMDFVDYAIIITSEAIAAFLVSFESFAAAWSKREGIDERDNTS